MSMAHSCQFSGRRLHTDTISILSVYPFSGHTSRASGSLTDSIVSLATTHQVLTCDQSHFRPEATVGLPRRTGILRLRSGQASWRCPYAWSPPQPTDALTDLHPHLHPQLHPLADRNLLRGSPQCDCPWLKDPLARLFREMVRHGQIDSPHSGKSIRPLPDRSTVTQASGESRDRRNRARF